VSSLGEATVAPVSKTSGSRCCTGSSGLHPQRRSGFRLGRAPAVLPAVAALTVVLAGCRQDMHDQPKYRPLRGSELFADKRSARPLVEGTVARGMLREDDAFFTGKTKDGLVSELPLPLTPALLERGRTQYQVFCSPCHGRTGRGDGMIVQRGFKAPSSYHVDRLRQVPIGHFYDVITVGFGAMSDYSAQVAPQDRWAIAAYVRTLQFSQYAPASDVPADKQAELDKTVAGAAEDHGGHGAAPHGAPGPEIRR
jgi:mono/diheme cytochrome c family protein